MKIFIQFIVITALVMFYKISIGQNYIFSYTYQNITRINGGGTVEPGDIIEIRALMKVDKKATNIYYRDNVQPGFQLVANSMKIVTNEGLLFRGIYTDAGGDDVAMVSGTSLRVNIGSGATNIDNSNFSSTTGGGTIVPGNTPTFYGKTLFVVAYRLKVTGNYGDILYPTGTFYYDTIRSGSPRTATKNFSYPGIMIMKNEGLCQNYSSASFTAESSFGSGTLQNRVAGVNAPGYLKFNLSPSNPVDGQYSVANNTSATGATNNSAGYGGSSPTRVFNVWDIIGDHTGASNPALGNAPVAPGTNGGYMLVVNAAYPTGEAYSDIVSGLCPNTYYEFSAWVRNICGYCGIDSTDKSTNKPGVLPNLAFTINDIDYYTTGSIQWDGDWVKRGFIYKTGPTETSFKITIKNNAAGGGGNDWVLDDISLATCYPNLIMSPTDTAKVCAGGIANLYDTVRSYFNNYTYYCWQKSTDGGATWVGTGNCGVKTPVLKNGMWEYIVDTSFTAAFSDSGNYYRVIVATTNDNLSNSSCSLGNNQKVFMKVFNYDCSILGNIVRNLDVRMSARGYPEIKWTTLNEEEVRDFELQRSLDGKNFNTIYSTPSLYPGGGRYLYEDTGNLNSTVFYRILINDINNHFAYSRIVSLYIADREFKMKVKNNPFTDRLGLEIFTPNEGILDMRIVDSYGRPVRRKTINVSKGENSILLEEVSSLPRGMYILTAVLNGKTLQNKIIKNN